MTILLGIAGSRVGGLLTSLLGLAGAVPGLIGAVLGAMIPLGVFRLVKN